MRLKNSSRRSVLAFAITSLLCSAAAAQQRTPAIALIDAADAPQWQGWAKDSGWGVMAAPQSDAAIDLKVQALEKAVQEAIRSDVDPARIYIAGRGDAAAAVFYAISRVPD